MIRLRWSIVLFANVAAYAFAQSEPLSLSQSFIVGGADEAVAASVLAEEVKARTGLELKIQETVANVGVAIELVVDPAMGKANAGSLEGYRIEVHEDRTDGNSVQIAGATKRGLLFGVGRFLQLVDWAPGTLSIRPMSVESSPAYSIRGHQLGYRHAANSWDAWTAEQFDQHIRELALFGANCIENIPFQDDRSSPLMRVPRDEMNLKMSEICAKYDLDYWVWTPADFDLKDEAIRAEHLVKHEALYKACPRLDGVFFPGGDPGDNDPSLVMPFLKDISDILHKHHPKAGVWMSLQGYNAKQVDWFYDYMDREKPTWFTGVVSGPSSPAMDVTRQRLAPQYKHRHYPDITHSVRAQYPVQWWDPAFGLTLGRECINPRPVFEANLHNYFAPLTDGFLTYSDGVHDDVNKDIWSMRAWDPDLPVRDMLIAYTRFFFGPHVAEEAADGILALENNWNGAITDNGGIDGTLALWERLDAKAPELRGNWRWQMCQLRAVYDAYQRHRSIYEAGLEKQANALLLATDDPLLAMEEAMAILNQAESQPVKVEWRARIESLCADLFKSVQLQTSVPKYTASGAERGAVLDMADRPLNNRWWLEDEFRKVRELATKEEQRARLTEIARWERPGPGQFYDSVGDISKSLHVVHGETVFTDPLFSRNPNPDHVWKDSGLARDRISWLTYMDWPIAVRYDSLDPAVSYVIEIRGQGEAFTFADGERLTPTAYGKTPAEVKRFPVPAAASKDGVIVVTWERPDEEHLNWRQRSRINEIRLVKATL